ncbi:hypothetical protein GQ43DRAFT_164034 [Delitschia confertaspora ATCC 74209]|uniref:Pleckstrin homology domain-containing protein n=1 Tax=Delitschia confertaspora ATCC 74209 TaxID=1513339 RepID=A0A9P4JI09_9PLEO|nr:hypothetical protein GQ43DRAFT_164034 [Delitschia confertaspora ATCC 74209]
MATDYFQDHEYVTNQALPSPAGTPYYSLSQRSSRYGTPGTGPSSSPPPRPLDDHDGSDFANDENISILDPRRFTPTLHASLVSEILSLRRELDSKHKFIEDLETSLEATRNDNDALASQLSATTKENRAVKRQLEQLENGTVSAIEELAGERDKVKETTADLKLKLESTQKKLRSQEDDSERVHDMWAREKEEWAGEKRLLQRRVHVSESRLKQILEELAARSPNEEDEETDTEDIKDGGAGHESDTSSIRSSPQRRMSSRLPRHSRNQSNGSYRSIGRNYRMSYMSGIGPDGRMGLSLADELAFDEEEEELEELELDSDDFPEHEMRARRALESRQSMNPDDKAKRILGLPVEQQETTKDVSAYATEAELPRLNSTFPSLAPAIPPRNSLREFTTPIVPPKPEYVDTGVQSSPPSSPMRPGSAATAKSEESGPSISEVEANQSRKRTSVTLRSAAMYTSRSTTMTSSSSQTAKQPLSPPETPRFLDSTSETPTTPTLKADVASTSTQTEPLEEKLSSPVPPPIRAPSPAPILIPSIAIHPPLSAPSSPKDPILPPHTKSVSTQTMGDLIALTRSVSMQTEPIRIDKRPVKLPPHLLPSAISSKPGTPEPEQKRPITASQTSTARKNLLSLLEKAVDSEIEDRYPGNNDNGPLSRQTEDILRRPFRTSSLFAGFEGASSDEEDHDVDLSDDDFRAPQIMLSSRNVKNGRVFNNPPTPVPEDKEVVSSSRLSEDPAASGMRSYSSNRTSLERAAKVAKPIRGSLTRQPSVRRSALIHSGAAAHMHRSRSPSFSSIASSSQTGGTGVVPEPPFPVPTRSSSRRIPMSKSEGSQSPTPRGGGGFVGGRGYGARPHQRKDSLRKVRSAAVIQKTGRARSRSPSLPAPPVMPPSPQLPPLPTDMISGQRFGHRQQPSTNTLQTVPTSTNSLGSAVSQTNVVDAIATTMVGEWMWKYVRKRKTFGPTESPIDENAAGVRHKRWVWISPYERAVLWSSKQPTSGSALLGKSGRKLVIQNVFDVADTTPLPRNAGTTTLFNRSILIVTPARALKFTTISLERHYLWLTAFSFLAHSGSASTGPDIAPLVPSGPLPPPAPIAELPPRQAGATLRRTQIRDSVRLAKGKANPITARLAAARAIEPLPPVPDFYTSSTQGFDNTPVADSAEPPSVPRGPHQYHGRKRSSTGPRAAPPPSVAAFRSFSHQQMPSVYSTGSSDLYMQPPSVPSTVYNPTSVSGIASSRTSEASSSARHNFFDSMGTVRMEAFIEPILSEESAPGPKVGMGRRRRNSQWSNGTSEVNRSGGLYEDFVPNGDLFRGF